MLPAVAGRTRAVGHPHRPYLEVMAKSVLRYVPYLFIREFPESGEGDSEYATRLPYIAFLQRHQSRWSRLWEDGDGETLTAHDFWTLLRSIYVVVEGAPEEAALIAAGAKIAARLNALEDKQEVTEALAVGDCENYLPSWPSWGDENRVPLFVCAHNFDAWNQRPRVWEQMRACPVEFKPIPETDLALLNQWLFGRYRFSKNEARAHEQMLQAQTAGVKHNAPRNRVADGLLTARRNAAGLIAVSQRTTAL